jgi:hypothetical protein
LVENLDRAEAFLFGPSDLRNHRQCFGRRGKEVRRVEHAGWNTELAWGIRKTVQQLKRELVKGLLVGTVKLPLAYRFDVRESAGVRFGA